MSDDQLNNIQPGDDAKWHQSISVMMNELITVKRELQQKNSELQQALDQVKELNGLLPMCASCKNIRDDQGYWQSVEGYISAHSEATFTHGLCPACVRKLYPDIADEVLAEQDKDTDNGFPPPSKN
ncbi:MAG: hypothetical protein ACRKGH_04355 [Dehalogenimonas sp.]